MKSLSECKENENVIIHYYGNRWYIVKYLGLSKLSGYTDGWSHVRYLADFYTPTEALKTTDTTRPITSDYMNLLYHENNKEIYDLSEFQIVNLKIPDYTSNIIFENSELLADSLLTDAICWRLNQEFPEGIKEINTKNLSNVKRKILSEIKRKARSEETSKLKCDVSIIDNKYKITFSKRPEKPIVEVVPEVKVNRLSLIKFR